MTYCPCMFHLFYFIASRYYFCDNKKYSNKTWYKIYYLYCFFHIFTFINHYCLSATLLFLFYEDCYDISFDLKQQPSLLIFLHKLTAEVNIFMTKVGLILFSDGIGLFPYYKLLKIMPKIYFLYILITTLTKLVFFFLYPLG